MADYSMTQSRLQEQKYGDKTIIVDMDTGEIVETLQDNKFAWRERKQGTLMLADIYDTAGMPERADKLKGCSTWLEYLAKGDLSKRELHHFNACKQRLCPICSVRKARIMALKLQKVAEKTLNDHPGSQFIFLTLTVENCTGDKLREALDLLTKSWSKLTRRTPFVKAVKGWFRALEITRNRSKDTYHPHIHAILVVEDDYFRKASGLYITQDKWVTMWQQSLKVSYKPLVSIERTKARNGNDKVLSATMEAAKYATKSAEYISPKLPKAEAAKVAAVYTNALVRKRMTAMGGWMQDAAKALELDVEADVDLVHSDDASGELTEASAELLEEYNWHFGVGNHLLSCRMSNPDYEGEAPGDAEG